MSKSSDWLGLNILRLVMFLDTKVEPILKLKNDSSCQGVLNFLVVRLYDFERCIIFFLRLLR